MTCSIGHISCVIVSFVRHMSTVVKFSPSACALAAFADDDDEIILGIIALVVVRAE